MSAKIVEYALEVKTKQAQTNLKATGAAAQQAATQIEAAQKRTSTAVNASTQTVKHSRTEWLAFRKEGANIDRLTGELAGGLGLISPQLGAIATAASLAGGAVEAVGRAMLVTNLKMLAFVGGVGVLVGAYKIFTGASEEAAKEAEKHRKRLDELNTAATSASAALYDAARANEELKNSEADQEEVIQKLIEKRYEILGLIDDEDVKMLERDRKVRAFGKKQLDIAQQELDNLRKSSKAIATKMKATKANAEAMRKDGKMTKDRSKGITQLMRRWVDLSLEQDKNTKVMQRLKSEIKSFEAEGTKGFGAIANATQRFQSELILLDQTMAQVAAGEIPGAPKPRRGGGGSRRKQRAAEVQRMVEAIEGRLNDTFDTLKDLGDEGVAQQETALKLQLRRLMVDEQSINNRTRANKGIVEQTDSIRLQAIAEERNIIMQQLKAGELKRYEEGLRETLKAQDEGIEKSKEDLKVLIKNRGKRHEIAKAEYEILEAEDHRKEFAKIINPQKKARANLTV